MARFPAEYAGDMPDGTAVHRPLLSVTVSVKKRALYQGIVDSGADNTIISVDLVEPLGAKWQKLTDAREELGAGGPFETRHCAGQIYYDGVLVCNGFRVAEQQTDVTLFLLGRVDFFKKFVASFHFDESPPWFEIDRAPGVS